MELKELGSWMRKEKGRKNGRQRKGNGAQDVFYFSAHHFLLTARSAEASAC
jgi:hypothetical protein